MAAVSIWSRLREIWAARLVSNIYFPKPSIFLINAFSFVGEYIKNLLSTLNKYRKQMKKENPCNKTNAKSERFTLKLKFMQTTKIKNISYLIKIANKKK